MGSRGALGLRARDLLLRAGRGNTWVIREDLARRYLTGDGIEIGPMIWPLRVPPGVRVRYVDRFDREELIRREGPQLRADKLDPERIPEIHVTDDADRLASFADGSLDFVIANHVLEHLEDPVGALEHLLRVLREGGVVYLTLPDAGRTFDRHRTPTSVEHALRDHREGPHVSRREHYEEWARLIEGVGEDGLARRVAEFEAADARHHFHAWRLDGFLALVLAAGLPCEVVHAQAYVEEFAVILRRAAARPAPG